MPDYEIREWNETNFDINSIPWTKEAISIGKWSLASDYIRHYAIYKYGGIYMDTDVMAYKSFDESLKHDFFTSVEFHPEGFDQHRDIDDECFLKMERNMWKDSVCWQLALAPSPVILL